MGYSLVHHTDKKLSPGSPQKLGATLSKGGVNFSLYSQYAKEVFLLLFDVSEGDPSDIIKIENCTNSTWHVFVHGLEAGQLYGYKIRGDYNPRSGVRFNEHKLLIDPYAKALTGKCVNKDNLLLAYDPTASEKDLIIDRRDNTRIVPKSVVIDDSFDWQDDRGPNTPLEELIIYEVHLKGFTSHPTSVVQHSGTYLGFMEKISYLKELGINAVEFLPIHEFYVQDTLIDKGLTDYWGYNTIGFFTPESSYSTQSYAGCQVREFKTLVRALHREGIEVLLDVVYNHTGEGNELGPTVCFKGVDNPTYYALSGTGTEPYRYYINDTGVGNTFNVENLMVMRLVIDSLRYWVEVMHVDGFRFDLASILARVKAKFSEHSTFFRIIAEDPVLKCVKLIAEPWDLTTYQVGNFPQGWSEWNGRFRDTVRRFLKGEGSQIKELGWRFTGSADLYGDDGRSPYNSINFVTCHDGFTLRDLYSYTKKYNETNLNNSQDGVDDNISWNCGVEGDTEDAHIIQLRKQMVRNAFCILFFSVGTPMLLHGDEVMRTQRGNNNVYCQDNELSWFNWEDLTRYNDIFEFCKKTIVLRNRYTVLQRRKFLKGKDMDGDTVPDIAWFGESLSKPSWSDPNLKVICYQLDGSEKPSEFGNYHLFFIYCMDDNSHTVKIPQYEGIKWHRIVDTSLHEGNEFCTPDEEVVLDPPDHYVINPRSIVVLLGK
jgi:isoamylase